MKLRKGTRVKINFDTPGFCKRGDIATICGVEENQYGRYYKMKEYMEKWPQHGFEISLFEVISKGDLPKTELEWLDRVQENFKE